MSKKKNEGVISKAAHAIADAVTGSSGSSEPVDKENGDLATPSQAETQNTGGPVGERALSEIEKHPKYDKFGRD